MVCETSKTSPLSWEDMSSDGLDSWKDGEPDLNLENFEIHPAADDARFILTSPRSLRSCRMLRIKPVELLNSSHLSDLSESGETGKERKAKLQLCRDLRRKLIAIDEDRMRSTNGRLDSGQGQDYRKKRHEDENWAKVAAAKFTFNGENDVSRDLVEKAPSCLDVATRTRSRTHSSRSRTGVSTLTWDPDTSRVVDQNPENHNCPKEGERPKTAHSRPKQNGGKAKYKQRPSSSPHLERSKKATRSPALNRHFPILKPEIKICEFLNGDEVDSVSREECRGEELSGTLSSSVSGSLSSGSKECRVSKKKTVIVTEDCWTDEDKDRLTPCSGKSRESLNESQGNNVSTSFTPQRSCRNLGGLYSRVPGGSMRQLRSVAAQDFIDNSIRSLPGYRSLMALDVPDEDRRILELMATRRLVQAENERHAYETRLAWEEDRGNTIYAREQRIEQRRQQLAEHRKQESAENTRRYTIALENYQRYREQLVSLMTEKKERADRLLQEIRQWKVERLQERHSRWLVRQEEILNAKQELGSMEASTRNIILQRLDERMQMAEERKKAIEEEQKQRLLFANQQEEARFQERRRQIEEKIEVSLSELRASLKDKQEKGSQVQSTHTLCREQEMLLRKQKQHEKYARARQFLDSLQTGMDKWRDHVAEIQDVAAKRAQQVVAKQLATRRKHLEGERNARKMAHQQKMEKLRAEEKDREQSRREQLSAKEKRVTDLVSTRDRMIQQGRHVAQTTATIRDHLKQELLLDTFDRRAARATLEAKVTLRNPVVKSPVNESTLVLG